MYIYIVCQTYEVVEQFILMHNTFVSKSLDSNNRRNKSHSRLFITGFISTGWYVPSNWEGISVLPFMFAIYLVCEKSEYAAKCHIIVLSYDDILKTIRKEGR